MKKITVGVVLYGTKYLDVSLKSLVEQDYEEVEFIFWDQEEGVWSAADYIEKEMSGLRKKISLHRGPNKWHSGGHNEIIRRMEGEVYFCCSNDMLYPRDFVSKIVEKLEENPEFGVATPRIKRWDFEDSRKTNVIDSYGIGVTDYHHFYDIGQGEEDLGQYDNMIEIFGVSGACGIYTKKALESVRFKNEYFDENMHYKNDVDLSYRLQWAGNRAMLVHEVTVFHDRQVPKDKEKSLFVRESSLLGEKILMLKNYSKRFPLSIRLKTKIYHSMKTIYLLLKEPKLFGTLKKFKTIKEETLRKKKAMKRVKSPEKITELME